MVYKTLHWYIFRELLRIFFLTASALTTLLAFGGMFKPFTKQGVEIRQLLVIMMNLMPAMLAYAIPIAALFAAVLVYWRISTDNELTACRAGGISFYSIVFPAFVLGVLVAAVDWGFVNYVVPKFLQATEQAVRRDAASILVNQINRQETYRLGKYVIYADAAHEEATGQQGVSRVILDGMAAAQLKNNKPEFLIIARRAIATINDHPDTGSSDFTCKLSDGAAFDPNTFTKVTGSVDSLPPVPIPSLLKDKPKFYNRNALLDLIHNPFPFPDVAKIISDMNDRYTFETIQTRVFDQWRGAAAAGKPLTFSTVDAATEKATEYRIVAPAASLSPDHQLSFVTRGAIPVRVDEYLRNVLQSTFTCDSADFVISADQFAAGATTARLQLNNARRRDVIRNIAATPAGTVPISSIQLSDDIKNVDVPEPGALLADAKAGNSPQLADLALRADEQIHRLRNTIGSEFNSRGSFSLSCLALVLLGAALGIELRGRNPLAVFVVGFVPAVILVLLITAGQQLAEGGSKHTLTGIGLIWAGNILLLAMVTAIYSVLLRR